MRKEENNNGVGFKRVALCVGARVFVTMASLGRKEMLDHG